MKKAGTNKGYSARWSRNGETLGNVSFFARNDAVAKVKAQRIAREIALPNTPYAIYEGTRLVAEVTP